MNKATKEAVESKNRGTKTHRRLNKATEQQKKQQTETRQNNKKQEILQDMGQMLIDKHSAQRAREREMGRHREDATSGVAIGEALRTNRVNSCCCCC